MKGRDWFYKYVYYPYSLVYIGFFGLDTALFATLAIIFSVLIPNYGKTAYWWGWLWAKINIALTGIRLEVEGLENIEPDASYIVMSNHQSHVDIWAMFAGLPLQLRWVMKKELRQIPIFGYATEKMGHIIIDRSNAKSAIRSLDKSIHVLKHGISVVFYPEGSRSDDGNLLPFKKGGFVMAMRTKTPILPVSISGSRFVLPKKTLKLHPGRIKVVVHPPIPMAHLKNNQRYEIVNEVRRIIESGLDQDINKSAR